MQPQASSVHLSPTGGREWLASRLLRRQVVNAYTLEPLGRITDVVFDPERCQLAALKVQSEVVPSGMLASARRAFNRQRQTVYVGLEHLVALNGDVVTVDVNPAHPAASARVQRLQHLSGVRDLAIITLHGMSLGSLVDLLVDQLGSVITGYVINPTRQADALFAPLEDFDLTAPRDTQSKADAPEAADASDAPDAADAASASVPSPSGLRILPASPRVRFGDALILVVEDVEPLQRETVVITSAMEAQPAVGSQSGRALGMADEQSA